MKKKQSFAVCMQFLKGDKKVLASCLVFCCVCAILPLVLPVLEGYLLGSIATDGGTIALASWLFAVGLVLEICRFFEDFSLSLMSARVEMKIKQELLQAISNMKIKSLSRAGTGVFTTRINDDSVRLAESYGKIFASMFDVVSNAAFLLFLFVSSWILGAYTLLGILLLFVLVLAKTQNWIKGKKRIFEQEEKVDTETNEIVLGAGEAKRLGSDVSLLRAKNELERQKKVKTEEQLKQNAFSRSSGVLELLLTLGFVIVSVMLIRDGKLLVSTFFVVYVYRTRTGSFVSDLAGLKGLFAEANLSCERILEITEGNRKFLKQTFGEVEIKKIKGKIEAVDVGVKFSNKRHIFHKINFAVGPNEAIAIYGASGSGKTTLLSVLAGETKPTAGLVLVDDKEIGTLSKHTRQKSIAFVSAEPFFFSGSVKENLRWANPVASFDEIVDACKLAGVHGAISSRPKGYDSELGERQEFSSGERERLALARAIISKSKILLLDEPTQNQDEDNRRAIAKAIAKLKQNHTIIVATHDFEIAKSCNRVFKLKNGRLIPSLRQKEGAMLDITPV